MASDAAILLSELRHVVADLQRLVGRPISGVRVPSPTSLVLDVMGTNLWVETWPDARLVTTDRPPRNPRTPYSFQGLLRSRLHGTIDRIALVGEDRVVEIDVGIHTLHARLLGRGGGIWLVAQGVVVASSEGPAPPALPAMPDGRPDASPPRFTPGPAESWDAAAGRVLGAWAREAALDRRRTHVRRALSARRKRARRLVSALTEDAARLTRVDQLRLEADALAGALHTLRKGMTEVTLPHPDGESPPLTLVLDPALKPVEAMERRYATARRLEGARDDLATRIADAHAEHERLEAAIAAVATADRAGLASLIQAHGLPPYEQGRPTAAPADPWETWEGPRGEHVWMGRSAKANHALTFGRARGRDWWLHRRGAPGAHAILPRDDADDTPPLDLLLAAARLLLREGRVPRGEAHDVQYARVRDLRPVKGSPGTALVTREKVLHVAWQDDDLTGWTRTVRAAR